MPPLLRLLSSLGLFPLLLERGYTSNLLPESLVLVILFFFFPFSIFVLVILYSLEGLHHSGFNYHTKDNDFKYRSTTLRHLP